MHHIEILFHEQEGKYLYPLYREGLRPWTKINEVKALFDNGPVDLSTHSEMALLTILQMVRLGEINHTEIEITESFITSDGDLYHNRLDFNEDGEFFGDFLNGQCGCFCWRMNLLM